MRGNVNGSQRDRQRCLQTWKQAGGETPLPGSRCCLGNKRCQGRNSSALLWLYPSLRWEEGSSAAPEWGEASGQAGEARKALANSEPPLGIFGTPWSILTQRVGPRNQELQTQFQSPVKTLPQGLKAMVSEHPKNAEHALERPARARGTVKALG